jgi:hypothetical protein
LVCASLGSRCCPRAFARVERRCRAMACTLTARGLTARSTRAPRRRRLRAVRPASVRFVCWAETAVTREEALRHGTHLGSGRRMLARG